jgi:uncharacterized delta-60 repeat protein
MSIGNLHHGKEVPMNTSTRIQTEILRLVIISLALFLTSSSTLPDKVMGASLEWTRKYNDKADGGDIWRSVAVAPDGSVYAAGYVYISGQTEYINVIKYSSAGKRLWRKTFDSGTDDRAYGVAAGPDGSVCVVGHTTPGGLSARDIWVRKYSPKGKVKWTDSYGSSVGVSWENGNGVAVTPGGSIYAVGSTLVENEGRNIWLRKYGAKGKVKWTKTYNRSMDGGASADDGYGVTVAPNGRIYVVGTSSTAAQGLDLWLIKVSTKGALKKSKTFNEPGSILDDVGYSVAAAPDGGIYVTGYSSAPPNNRKLLVVKYSSRLKRRWYRIVDKGYGWDTGRSLSVGPDGGLYVAGDVYTGGTSDDIFLRKYTPGGKSVWTKRFNGKAGGYDNGYGVAVTPLGEIYLGGSIYEDDGGHNAWLRKYR